MVKSQNISKSVEKIGCGRGTDSVLESFTKYLNLKNMKTLYAIVGQTDVSKEGANWDNLSTMQM